MKGKLDVQVFYPRHELLKKFIAYYYFLKTDLPDFESVYYSFPTTLKSLNIHKGAKCFIDGHSIITESDLCKKYLMVLQGRYEKPLFVQLKGVLDKITIAFTPLGLNQFIEAPFSKVAKQPLQLFREWDTDLGYPSFLEPFFFTPNNTERVRILESFLLSVYSPLNAQAVLQKAIDLLSDFDEELPVIKVAAAVGLNNRTFDRMFQKHVGITPVGFRKIARFRHSLKNKLVNQRFRKLTEIGYESNFYDQSYFIKIYNQLAGACPKTFFNSVDKLANDNLVFRFINK